MSETTIPAEDRPDNPEVHTEPRDVSPRGVLLFGFGLALVLVASNLIIWGLFNFLDSREEARKQSPFPLASAAANQLPPPPRLEGIEQVQGHERPVYPEPKFVAPPDLSVYRWVDGKPGVAQIPLDAAMKLIVEQNLLPSRPKPAAERKKP